MAALMTWFSPNAGNSLSQVVVVQNVYLQKKMRWVVEEYFEDTTADLKNKNSKMLEIISNLFTNGVTSSARVIKIRMENLQKLERMDRVKSIISLIYCRL